MIGKLLFLIGSGLILILMVPLEYKSYLPRIALYSSSLVLVYSILIARKFDLSCTEYMFLQEVDLYLGLDLKALIVVVLVTASFLIGLVINWDEIQNKTFLICFLGLEFALVLIFSSLWV